MRRDSAGIEVVENRGDDVPLAAALTRDFSLGGDDSGPGAFFRVAPWWLSVGPTGLIAVLDEPNSRVALFDADGVALRAFGREGEGPGELARPSAVLVTADDGVAVFDYRKRAILEFTATGDLVAERRFPLPFNGAGWGRAAGGLVVSSREAPRGDGESLWRLVYVSVTDTVTLGPAIRSAQRSVFYRSCGVRLSQPPLFAPDLIWATNGRRTAVVRGAGYAIEVFDGLKLASVVRRAVEAEPVTEEAARRVLGEGERWLIGERECVVPVAELMSERGHAPVVPPIAGVTVSPSGAIWVRRTGTAETPGVVDVFDPSGTYVGTLDAGSKFPVRFLPDGRFLTIEKDSVDVERVVAYASGLPGILTGGGG